MYRVEGRRGHFIEVTNIAALPEDVSGVTTIRITLRIVLNENGSNWPCTLRVDLDRRVDPGQISFDSEVAGAIRDMVNELQSLCGSLQMSAEIAPEIVRDFEI